MKVKGLSINTHLISHPIFGTPLNATQSEKPPHSSALPRFFSNHSVQICPRSYCECVQVIFTQVLTFSRRGGSPLLIRQQPSGAGNRKISGRLEPQSKKASPSHSSHFGRVQFGNERTDLASCDYLNVVKIDRALSRHSVRLRQDHFRRDIADG